MLRGLPGIGLDIDNRRIRIVWARKNKVGWRIIKFGSREIPAGMVEAGNINDSAGLGEQIGVLVKELDLQNKKVTTAVGGQQIYMRNLTLPGLHANELKEAVYYQAFSFLPIPVDEAALDIYPLQEYKDKKARKVDVFFVAVRKQQVEDIAQVCRVAGLKLAAVEIEPLALWRTWKEVKARVAALLAIGSDHACFCIFKDGAPVLHRYLAYAVEFDNLLLRRAVDTNARPVDIGGCLESSGAVGSMMAEVKMACDYYQLQAGKAIDPIEKLLLCGGGAVRGLPERLAQELNLEVELWTDNVWPRLTLPASISAAETWELQNEFPLALGLAAWG